MHPSPISKTMHKEPTSTDWEELKGNGGIRLKFGRKLLNGSRRPPNGSRTSQQVAPVDFLNCWSTLDGSRTTQRVTHLVRRVAPLSAARNFSFFAPFSQSLSLSLLQALECTMRVKGGNLGFYKSHLKKFHLQTHFLIFFFWHFITLIFGFLYPEFDLLSALNWFFLQVDHLRACGKGTRVIAAFLKTFWNFIPFTKI